VDVSLWAPPSKDPALCVLSDLRYQLLLDGVLTREVVTGRGTHPNWFEDPLLFFMKLACIKANMFSPHWHPAIARIFENQILLWKSNDPSGLVSIIF
jgi:hypothetical protein